MKNIAIGLMAIMLITITGCSMGGSVGLVKRTRNAAGITASQIPNLLYNRLGFKVQSAKWVERAEDGFAKVILDVKAVKASNEGPVYMSYSWSPKWKWSVEKSTRTVIPTNKLAKDWMRGIM